MTVDAFLGSLRLKATEAEKLRDSDWMANYLSSCVEGPALTWYESLDEDTQHDWKKLRAALIEKYSASSIDPPVVVEELSVGASPGPAPPPYTVSSRPTGSMIPPPAAISGMFTSRWSSVLSTLENLLPNAPSSPPPEPTQIPQTVISPIFDHLRTYTSSEESGPITSFAFTPAGVSPPRIALSYEKGDIATHRLDTDDSEEAMMIKVGTARGTNTLQFSPDGNFIAYDTVAGLEPYTGRPRWFQITMREISGLRSTFFSSLDPFRHFLFSPFDLSLAILTNGGAICHLDIMSKKLSTRIPISARQFHFIADSKNAMAVLDDAGQFTIYDWGTGASLFRIATPNKPLCISSPSIALIASGGQGGSGSNWNRQFSIHVWDGTNALVAPEPARRSLLMPGELLGRRQVQLPLIDNSKIKHKLLAVDFLSSITAITCSIDGLLLAVRGEHVADCIVIMQNDSLATLPSTLTDSPWKEMTFPASGTLYATLHEDNTVRLHRISL